MDFTRIGLAVCTPIPYERTASGHIAPEMVSIDWHRHRMSLALPTNYNLVELFIDGEEVGAARNIAVQRLLALPVRPKFLLFIDYDVLPSADAITKLVYRAETYPDHDIFCGVYCSKGSPAEPLIYEGNGLGPCWDWSLGDLLFDGRIKSCHMGLTLIRTSLFERMVFDDDHPLFLTQSGSQQKAGGVATFRGTEDIYFCGRATEEAGAKIFVDSSVLAGHQCKHTRIVFGLPNDSPPVKRARWLAGAKEEPDKPKLKALDLGAGGFRREWKDHETFTTDLRADTKPDYVMDSRLLNLPDNSFDLCASSHHLEHLGRFDQEKVWSEIYRITKPGGRIEHIVPNVIWASAKFLEVETGRDTDGYEDALNVLYGAQEMHGYGRDLNTHYFGYTPRLAKALAEHAGFVEVETESYKEVEGHGYNLWIKGRKLNEGEERPAVPAPIVEANHQNNGDHSGAVSRGRGRKRGGGRIRDTVVAAPRKVVPQNGKSRTPKKPAKLAKA